MAGNRAKKGVCRKIGRKSIFFTLDALVAAGILLMGILIMSSYHINRQPIVHLSYLSEDLMGVLSELKVSEVNDSYVQELIANGNITNLNNSIVEQIGEFWAEDKIGIAENFTIAVLGNSIPQIYGYSFLVDDEAIYTSPNGVNYSLISSSKIVSGYAKLKPVLGYVSKAFLTGIKDRKSSSFAYFGGFEGQGNLTKKIFLPQNITNITQAYLEVEAGQDFDLYINGNYAGHFVKGSSGGSFKIPDKWVLNQTVHSYFHEGENNFSIVFSEGDLMEHFISGGFLRVTYVTPDTDEIGVTYNPDGTATRRYWFPGISGIVNLYSSFDVPGTLQSMSLHLHIISNYSTYITIGNRLMMLSEGNVTEPEQIIDIGNSNFSSPPDPLDYNKMSNSTVPLRFASYKLVKENLTSGNLDLIIITDMSGSMKKAVSSNDQGNLGTNCASIVNDSSVRRTELAKCLDKEMIGEVMKYGAVRVWLIELFDTDVISNWTRPTAEELYDVIDTDFQPNGKGKTCLSCAVNEAYNIFDKYSSPGRFKALVLMTDGIPTHIANGTKAVQEVCVGYCDTTGACGSGDIEGCNDYNCIPAANDTEQALQRVRDDFNADIYGVGFGPVSECTIGNETLREIIEPPNGTYYSSNESIELKNIYSNITNKILEKMTQENQTVGVIGNVTEAILLSDSYLEINYTPIVNPPVYGEIPLTVYSNEFGNNISEGHLFIPEELTLVDLWTTSYSNALWTENVTIYDGTNYSNAFGLFDSSLNYTKLGDPFIVMIPADKASYNFNNTITVVTADAYRNSSGGSPADRLIYTVRMDSLLDYGNVFFKQEGCSWFIEFEDGTNGTIDIPGNYTGSEQCYYANATYDNNDAMADAAYRLFDRLDFDNNGKIEVNFDENNIAIDFLTVADVPSLWGPALVEVRVW